VVPLVSGIDDTSNFDQYAESVIDVDEPLPDPAEALQAFKDFWWLCPASKLTIGIQTTVHTTTAVLRVE